MALGALVSAAACHSGMSEALVVTDAMRVKSPTPPPKFGSSKFGFSKFGSSKFVKVRLLKVRSLRDLFRLLKVHVSLANVDAHAMKALGHTHGTVNATV